MTDYVYGVVEPGVSPPEGGGVAGAPVRLVANGSVAALVSDMGADELRLGREDLLAHAGVLERALANGTVLPMRFGVLMEGDEEVQRRVLEEHAAELQTQLQRFRDKVEVTIRATYDERMLMREVLSENPEIADLKARLQNRPEDATYYERIGLGERVAHAIERKRARDARDIVDALSQAALECLPGEPTHERVALNAAFLVERNRLDEFDEVLDAFATGQAGRLRFKYTGPLPPHSFVELERVG